MTNTTLLIEKTDTNFWQKHRTKIVPLFFWLIIIAVYFGYTRQNNLTLADSAFQVTNLLTRSFYGPIIYIILYILRPIIFFPSTVLTLLGGFFFGIAGILYTIVGGNISALVAFAIGHYFGDGVLENNKNDGIIQKYAQRLRQNSFETVLVMRLILLPYDLVNYAAGFLKVNWRSFLLATIIGSLPGTISVVLLGTSFGTLDELLMGNISLNPWALVASVVLTGIGVVLSRHIKQRETV